MKRQPENVTARNRGREPKWKFPSCFSFRQEIKPPSNNLFVALCFPINCSCTQHSIEVCTKRLSFILWPSSCSSVDVITARPKAITFTNPYRREFSGCLSNDLHSFWKLFLCCNLLVRWSLISNFLRKIYQDLILADPLYKEPWERGCQNFLVWWRCHSVLGIPAFWASPFPNP